MIFLAPGLRACADPIKRTLTPEPQDKGSGRPVSGCPLIVGRRKIPCGRLPIEEHHFIVLGRQILVRVRLPVDENNVIIRRSPGAIGHGIKAPESASCQKVRRTSVQGHSSKEKGDGKQNETDCSNPRVPLQSAWISA